MSYELVSSQTEFLKRGGGAAKALAEHKKVHPAMFSEYPKVLRFPRGEKKVSRTTETIDKRTLSWTETVPDVEEIVVASEEEEERVLAGGKTNEVIESERQRLFAKARAMNIPADPSWNLVRLKREIGEELATAPDDEEAILRAKLAKFERIKALRAQVAALEAETVDPVPVAQPRGDDAEIARLRGILEADGVSYDKRWGVARLRDAVAEIARGEAA